MEREGEGGGGGDVITDVDGNSQHDIISWSALSRPQRAAVSHPAARLHTGSTRRRSHTGRHCPHICRGKSTVILLYLGKTHHTRYNLIVQSPYSLAKTT